MLCSLIPSFTYDPYPYLNEALKPCETTNFPEKPKLVEFGFTVHIMLALYQ